MKQRRVVTTPEADEDARRIDQWWMQNRSAAPNLFVEELADALALLGIQIIPFVIDDEVQRGAFR